MVNTKFRVGITGTRHGGDEVQLRELRSKLWMLKGGEGPRADLWLLHGDCVGVDSEAHDIAKRLDYFVHIFPPKQDTFRACRTEFDLIERPDHYHARNRAIVEQCDVLIAVPDRPESQNLRSGTWQTVRMARHADKKIIVIKGDRW